MKKPYISQPKGSMCCGAYTMAYYLWETDKVQNINERTFVDSIYEKIRFGKNNIGINEGCCNPQKMIEELNNTWHTVCYPCISEGSFLMQFANGLAISAANEDIFSKLKSQDSKYAIIITNSENSLMALHYLLIKYEDNKFKMLNSSAYYGNGTDNVTWQDFTIEDDGKLVSAITSRYKYTGAGIIID